MTARIKALGGGVVWGGVTVFFGWPPGEAGWTQMWLSLAALVLVPLALELRSTVESSAAGALGFRWLVRAQVPAALALTVALILPPGLWAASAALPWLACTLGLAAVALARLKAGGLRRSLDGLGADAAFIFAAGGGVALLADRAGYVPWGFGASQVLASAWHLHFAGLLLPLLAGFTQRELFFWRFPARAAIGLILAVPAVVFGGMAAQRGWGLSLATAAGMGLGLSGMAVAVLHVRIALESRRPRFARFGLGLAGTALFLSMVVTGLNALVPSAITEMGRLPLAAWHGGLDALGVGLGGVLAWRRMSVPLVPGAVAGASSGDSR